MRFVLAAIVGAFLLLPGQFHAATMGMMGMHPGHQALAASESCGGTACVASQGAGLSAAADCAQQCLSAVMDRGLPVATVSSIVSSLLIMVLAVAAVGVASSGGSSRQGDYWRKILSHQRLATVVLRD